MSKGEGETKRKEHISPKRERGAARKGVPGDRKVTRGRVNGALTVTWKRWEET